MNTNTQLNISSNSPGNKTNVFNLWQEKVVFTAKAERGQIPSSALKTCALFSWQEHLKIFLFFFLYEVV